jgi:phosphonate transport system substrate-binding protein
MIDASRRFVWAVAIIAYSVTGAATTLAQECKNRGQLDALYCDENNDLIADVPTDPTKLRDPATMTFSYTPVEDPAVYQKVFEPFTEFLAQCTGKPFVYYHGQSNSAEIQAMRSGSLHVAGFSTGPTGFAVNMAGAIPFAAKGTEKGLQGYHLLREEGQPLPETRTFEGQARCAHIAVVEFRTSRSPRALSAGRPQTERGLRAANVRRAR